MNRTLLDKARTMYVETDLPKYLWGEAIRTAALLLNRSPTFALNGGIPAVKWYGHNDLQKIRTFGCKAYAYVLPIPDKLSSRAIETRLVGYCDNGYRLWDIKDDKIITSRDVKFDERPLRAQVKEDQNKVIFHIEEEQSKLQDKSIRELEKDKKTR